MRSRQRVRGFFPHDLLPGSGFAQNTNTYRHNLLARGTDIDVLHSGRKRRPQDQRLRLSPLGRRGARGRVARGLTGNQRANGPLAFFQAFTPPSMWQAVLSPASWAACTAIAERSP